MNKEAEINKELIKVLEDKIQLLEEQKANSQEIINAQKEQLIILMKNMAINQLLKDKDYFKGYLINQFLVSKTNQRNDEYGGESFTNRMRLALEIVSETRKACGKDFIIIFRLSMLDLVKDGSSWEEIKALAQALEDNGVTIINTGIGWHEARIREYTIIDDTMD